MKDFERSDPKNNIAMNKKHYQKPEQRVVLLQHRTMLLSGSVRGVSTNMTDEDDDFLWGGGGTQDAR